MSESMLQRIIGEWHMGTFPKITPQGHLSHIAKEVDELKKAFEGTGPRVSEDSIEKIADESAGIMIMLFAIAHRLDFDMVTTIFKVFDSLQNRAWCLPNEQGIIEHVRVPGIGQIARTNVIKFDYPETFND